MPPGGRRREKAGSRFPERCVGAPAISAASFGSRPMCRCLRAVRIRVTRDSPLPPCRPNLKCTAPAVPGPRWPSGPTPVESLPGTMLMAGG